MAWFKAEMVLFRPGHDFIETIEYVLKAWEQTHAYQKGGRLQVWECAPYLTGIWWLHVSCSGYRGINSDIDIKQWLLAQWVLTSAYADGYRLQVWNVDSYDSTAALFEGITISRARTLAESMGLHKPALVKPEGAVEHLYTGLSLDEISAAAKRMADAGLTLKEAAHAAQRLSTEAGLTMKETAHAAQRLATAAATLPDIRATPSRGRAFLWHLVACVWPTKEYIQWRQDEHPRWKRRNPED